MCSFDSLLVPSDHLQLIGNRVFDFVGTRDSFLDLKKFVRNLGGSFVDSQQGMWECGFLLSLQRETVNTGISVRKTGVETIVRDDG